MFLLLVDDPLDVLLGVLVGQGERLLLVAVDRKQLVGEVLAQSLEVGVRARSDARAHPTPSAGVPAVVVVRGHPDPGGDPHVA